MKMNAFTKTYNNKTALTMPHMELLPGHIYAVIGANGSGKSTLAKALCGLIPCDEKQNPFMEKRLSIGYLPQKPFVFRLTTLRNILLGGIKLDDQMAKEKALDLMQRLSIDHLIKQSARRLSGGEAARMALARSMMQDYDLLILDEPTAALDVHSTILAEDQIIRYCRESNAAILLITHSLKQARRLAHEVWYLHEGHVIEADDAQNLLYSPTDERTRQFLDFYSL